MTKKKSNIFKSVHQDYFANHLGFSTLNTEKKLDLVNTNDGKGSFVVEWQMQYS